jgi:hypothetical protein
MTDFSRPFLWRRLWPDKIREVKPRTAATKDESPWVCVRIVERIVASKVYP